MRSITTRGDGPVGKLWPGSTVVCLASGPSLTRDDVEYVRGKARVIAINNTFQLAPWADAFWATDARWWHQHAGVLSCAGLKFSLAVPGLQYPKHVHVLKNTGREGLETDPIGVRNGNNGGHAAINLAVHLGATRILLLGYDCQLGPKGEEHWHGRHLGGTALEFRKWLQGFSTLVLPLRAAGVDVVNCTRRTAIRTFPEMPLDEALPQALEVAS